jgi:hypothetical protein
MKLAILLTGALRTIKRTMRYVKQSVLIYNDAEMFLCIQNDTDNSNEHWNNWFISEIGSYIKKIIWFSKDLYPEWISIREIALENLQLDGTWKNYLRHSGSMIEYYQLHLAYMAMSLSEQECGTLYDYIIRLRTDSIFTKPIDFHWLHWSPEQIHSRLEKIKQELHLSTITITPQSILQYFMCTIVSDDIIPNMQFLITNYEPWDNDTFLKSDDIDANTLHNYITHGRYILTFRKNNLYIVRRNLFYMIPSLATLYGHFRSPISDDYWFNAENQFRSACHLSCLTIFDYNSDFEEKTLRYPNDWKDADFFDLQMNCVNPYMLYCVVRK